MLTSIMAMNQVGPSAGQVPSGFVIQELTANGWQHGHFNGRRTLRSSDPQLPRVGAGMRDEEALALRAALNVSQCGVCFHRH